MSDLLRPVINLNLPIPIPTPGAQAVNPSLETASAAAPSAPEDSLAPAQVNALDSMMQGFLADGPLDAAEAQALEAARASFTGGWEGVPLPMTPAGNDPAALLTQAAETHLRAASAATQQGDTGNAASQYGAAATDLERVAQLYEAQANALLAGGAGVALNGAGTPTASPFVAPRPPAANTANSSFAAAAPSVAVAPTAGSSAPQSAGLTAALATYRTTILEHDKQAQGYNAMVFSGLTGVGDRPVNLLPGLMIPDGATVLSWAALDRAPTDLEMADYKALMAGADSSNAMMKIINKIMDQAPDRSAAAAKLRWSAADKAWTDTPQSLAQQAAFTEVMRQGMLGNNANAAPIAPAPVAPAIVPQPQPAPAGPVATNGDPTIVPKDYSALLEKLKALPMNGPNYAPQNLINLRDGWARQAAAIDPNAASLHWGDTPPTLKTGKAAVGPYTFDWDTRPNPGLLGGWDSPPLGKTYTTADAMIAWGGYNDLHYWPDCQDPAYKALWDLRFAANNGDKAAWTELAKLQLAGYDIAKFTEQRPLWVSSQFPEFKDKEGPAARKTAEDLAQLLLEGRDNWKAGRTQVVLVGDAHFVDKSKVIYADAIRQLDSQIQTLTAGI